jgi:hypothetical protein
MAELEHLHATFHSAASVHDPVNGDSLAVITQRIREVLGIWAEDGVLTIVNSTDTAGNYIGQGDPDDPATCPPPSGDTSATVSQGTAPWLHSWHIFLLLGPSGRLCGDGAAIVIPSRSDFSDGPSHNVE